MKPFIILEGRNYRSDCASIKEQAWNETKISLHVSILALALICIFHLLTFTNWIKKALAYKACQLCLGLQLCLYAPKTFFYLLGSFLCFPNIKLIIMQQFLQIMVKIDQEKPLLFNQII